MQQAALAVPATRQRSLCTPDRAPANRPNVLGTVIGAVFIGVVLDGMTMLNAPYYTQDFVAGALLAAALVISFTLAPARRRLSGSERSRGVC